jgi:hypothetical protein
MAIPLVIDHREAFTPGPPVFSPGRSQDDRQFLLRIGPHLPSSKKTVKGYSHIFREVH